MKGYATIIALILCSCSGNVHQYQTVTQTEGQKKIDSIKPMDSLVAASKLHINPKDTCEINEPDFKGYIMSSGSYAYSVDKNKFKFYKPSRKEVFITERFLKRYIDSFCIKEGVGEKDTVFPKNDREISCDRIDCIVIKKSFKKYFREYAGIIEMKNGHRHISIECYSPEMNEATRLKDALLKKLGELTLTNNMICDGGPVMFHVEVDLETGKVDFRDNGWA